MKPNIVLLVVVILAIGIAIGFNLQGE